MHKGRKRQLVRQHVGLKALAFNLMFLIHEMNEKHEVFWFIKRHNFEISLGHFHSQDSTSGDLMLFAHTFVFAPFRRPILALLSLPDRSAAFPRRPALLLPVRSALRAGRSPFEMRLSRPGRPARLLGVFPAPGESLPRLLQQLLDSSRHPALLAPLVPAEDDGQLAQEPRSDLLRQLLNAERSHGLRGVRFAVSTGFIRVVLGWLHLGFPFFIVITLTASRGWEAGLRKAQKERTQCKMQVRWL